MMDFKFLSLGVLFRVGGFCAGLHELVCSSPQFSTPISSVLSVKEGVYLFNAGISPYASDYYHGSPLMLVILNWSLTSFVLSCFVFITLDILVAMALAAITAKLQLVMKKEEEEEDLIIKEISWDPKEKKNSLGKEDLRNSISITTGPLSTSQLPTTVAALYFLNPFIILSCIAMNVNVVAHLAVLGSIYFTLYRLDIGGMITLALAANLQLYPLVLFLPVCLLAIKLHSKSVGSLASGILLVKLLTYFALANWVFLVISHAVVPMHTVAELLYLCFGRMLSLPDLKPNVGIWWYFFMETFDRFRDFFLVVFQVHPFLYVFPLTFQFYSRPILLAQVIYAIFVLFQPYPDMSGISFSLCMFLMHPRSICKMEHLLLTGMGVLIPSCIIPLMWYMWLYAGTGNANYYYFQNLILLLFLVTFIVKFIRGTLMRDRTIAAYRKAKRKASKVKKNE